ncbi:DUF4012 domain-containing protein [Cellulomonas palmilytica]|uniref:DUF4012 domain-containing protein n=1 Tax=Cellulomonas palmilytica TaxID=2608402 RepID=UPI001F15B1FD|nr:DUF4012 domain-containing protein [Cellulomonas palmilytica]UJP41119.1 DUF4012 domain-containing protein [Cellulomonas palmilytica]
MSERADVVGADDERAVTDEHAPGTAPDEHASDEHASDEHASDEHASDEHGGVPTSRRPVAPWRRSVRRVLLTLVVVLVVVLLLGVWLAWRGTQVASALADADAQLGTVREAVSAGDVAAVGGVLPGLQDSADRASAATGDPVWRVAEHAPWLGAQLSAVSAATDAFDALAHDALPPLVDVAGDFSTDALTPQDGRVDVASLTAMAPAVAQAYGAVDAAVAQLDAVDTDALVPQLADRLVPAREQLAELRDRLETADTALAIVPPLLGADGPRSYLVLVLNPAELRSAGGIVGSVLEVRTDAGVITVGAQQPARTMGRPDQPAVPLDPAERALLGDVPARYMQAVTATPDFARTAELASALWERETGRQVDGVLTVDPVVLARLLDVIGPTTTPDGTRLTSDDAVETLLSGAYARYPDATDSDTFFAQVAQSVVSATFAGGYSGKELVDAVGDVVGEGRVSVWTADDDVRERLRDVGLVHDFLADDAADVTAGVFLNDTTVSKMDYYLDTELTADDLTCSADGASAWLHLTLTSTAPADAATSLPHYVTGGGVNGTPAGSFTTQVLLYSPRGGTLGEIRVARDGGEPQSVGPGLQDHEGRQAGALAVRLAPGETATVDVHVTTATGADEVRVERTPTLQHGRTGPVLTCGTTTP